MNIQQLSKMMASSNSTRTRKYIGNGIKYGVGGAVSGGALMLSLNACRGQRSNSQLYSPDYYGNMSLDKLY